MEQVILGGNANQFDAATRYNLLWGAQATWSNNILVIEQLIATDGIIKNLRVRLNLAPGAGASWTYTLMVNGIATALTCTIADAAIVGADMVNEVPVAPGDYVCLRVTSAGAPVIPRSRYSVIFKGNTMKESLLLGGLATTSNAGVRYNVIAGVGTWGPAPADGILQCIPTSGVIKNLYIRMSVGAGIAPDAYRFTLEVNGVPSILTCTLTGAQTTGNDTIHSVVVAPGDLVRLISEPLNAPANNPNVSWGMCFVADIDHESLLLRGADHPNIANIRYHDVADSVYVESAVEAERQLPAQRCIAKKLYLALALAPGVANSWIWTLRRNAADTALIVTIVDPDTTGNNIVDEVNLFDDDDIDIEVTPIGFPNLPDWAAWGLVLNRTLLPVVQTDPATEIT